MGEGCQHRELIVIREMSTCIVFVMAYAKRAVVAAVEKGECLAKVRRGR